MKVQEGEEWGQEEAKKWQEVEMKVQERDEWLQAV